MLYNLIHTQEVTTKNEGKGRPNDSSTSSTSTGKTTTPIRMRMSNRGALRGMLYVLVLYSFIITALTKFNVYWPLPLLLRLLSHLYRED